jgi:thiamine biosynthesis lipoprotein
MVLGLGCAASPEPSAPAVSYDRPYSDGRVLMGTVLELQIFAGNGAAGRVLADVVFDEVARLERLVSHYDPESEVSRLASVAGRGPREVDPLVADLVSASLRLGELSRGAFDVTLGPAVEFWRTADPELPDRKQLDSVRERTGQDKLKLLPGNRVELLAPGMRLDFGGIAKGWALDRVARDLREAEVEAALLSFGQSSVQALGAPPGRAGWTLALRSPTGGIEGSVTLRDQALSISSSVAEGRSELDRDRAPIIDPRTRRPVDQPAQVAVVAADATSADAISTAILVLDPDSALKLVESLDGVEAMLVGERGQIWQSSGWSEVARYRSEPVVRRLGR